MGKGLFSFTYSIPEINGTFDDVSAAYKKAVANTLNKVGRQANRKAANYIKANYNVKAGDLKIGDKVRLQMADARKDVVSFIIRVAQSGRGLFKYGARQVKSGVRVKVGKRAKVVKGAFISTWRRGADDRFVFVRDEKLGYYTSGKSKRMKRRALYGPSIADLYWSKKVYDIIDKTISDEFQGALDEEYNRQFEKKRR